MTTTARPVQHAGLFRAGGRRAILGAVLGAAAAHTMLRAMPARAQAAPGPTAAPTPRRVVFVVSNPAVMAPDGAPLGYWLPELAHPVWAFTQRGWESTIASPDGGAVRHDQMSDPDGGRFGNPRDFISWGYKTAPAVAAELVATRPLSSIRMEDFDAIFVVGGFAPPTTFIGNDALLRLFVAFHEAGKVSAAICHGTCILLRAKRPDGTLLAAGRRWTGYTNAEEDVVDRVMGRRFQPFRIEDEATRLGAGTFMAGPAYRPNAVADGRLITGQQGSSGLATAELVIKALA